MGGAGDRLLLDVEAGAPGGGQEREEDDEDGHPAREGGAVARGDGAVDHRTDHDRDGDLEGLVDGDEGSSGDEPAALGPQGSTRGPMA